jgi:uncharacterized glyoxalase superfamily protein PhnB
MKAVHPYLLFRTDAEEAFAFYEHVLDPITDRLLGVRWRGLCM